MPVLIPLRVLEPLQGLWRWSERYGEPPTREAWEASEYGVPSGSYIVTVFGSWSRALEAAGFELRRCPWQRWTDEQIIEALRRDAAARGRPPTAREWKKAARGKHPSTGAVADRFGGWDLGLRAAGLEPRGRGHRVT